MAIDIYTVKIKQNTCFTQPRAIVVLPQTEILNLPVHLISRLSSDITALIP